MIFYELVIRILLSCYYGLMGFTTMVIKVTGRKSGKPVRLPVNFVRNGDDLLVMSSRERVWWKN